MMKTFLKVLITLFLFLPQITSCSDKNQIGFQLITANELLGIVEYLSSPELAGRLSGDEDYDKASEFVADYFKTCGLTPLAEDGYFQHLTVEYNSIEASVSLALVENDSIKKNYELGNDFLFRGFTGSGNLIAPVVFCGYGITSPENGYDDYAGVDVAGKVVLIFKPVPKWTPINGSWTNYGWPRVKTKIAVEHGAVGVLFVSHPMDWQLQIIGSILHGPGVQIEHVPQLHIDLSVANEFLTKSENNIKKLQQYIDSTKIPKSMDLNVSVKIEVHTHYEKEKNTQNVLGILEGSDPELKNEIVIVGAHLDHVGAQTDKIYFPGANDNASGTACVLQLVKALTTNKVKPKRTILFIAFASEEQGLFGSSKYVNSPIVPLEKTVAMINLDCVGFGDSIQVLGKKDFPNLFQMAYQHRDTISLLSAKSGGGGGADAYPFHKAKIPNLYFATTNSYKHLHKTTDTLNTLDAHLLESVAKLAFLTIWSIANGEYQKENLMTN